MRLDPDPGKRYGSSPVCSFQSRIKIRFRVVAKSANLKLGII
jgi:hypothetical protein